MARLSSKFVLLVVTIETVVDCAPRGYDYSKPAIIFELPNRPIAVPDILTGNRVDQGYHKTVSYTTLNKNTPQYQSNVHFESHFNRPDNNIISHSGTKENVVQNSQASFNIQNNVPPLHLQSSETSTLNGNVLDNTYSTLQTNNYFQNTELITNMQNNGLSVQNKPSSLPIYTPITRVENYQSLPEIPLNEQRSVTSNQVGTVPVITKHIYFHVPPPDIEERLQPVPSQPKKTYRILFIKLPAQETKNKAILQSSYNLSGKEEKTLIYVLVKKPEETQAIVPTSPKLSEHEVVFVKYRGNPSSNTEQIERVVEIPRRNIHSTSQDVYPGSIPSVW